MPGVGENSVPCEQAGQVFNVKVAVLPTPNPSFRRVDAQVMDGTIPVLRLSRLGSCWTRGRDGPTDRGT